MNRPNDLPIATRAGSPQPGTMPDAQETARLAAALQPFVDRGTLAGAVVLVASRDADLGVAAIGHADRAARTPMRADSLFWIASMSKPMTSSALMMLVDEGAVRLDDPVSTYLPEFTGQMLAVEQDEEHVLLKKPARPITVRDVLSHTSGLPFMSRLELGRIDTMSLREAVISYAMTPLSTQPGTAYAYSNAGINTAGRIIEVVRGKPYHEVMHERLFAPLGMTDTTFWPDSSQLARLAKAYRPTADKSGLEEIPIPQFTYPLDDRRRGPSPAGGYFSTATDMSRFCRMILGGGAVAGRRFLSQAAVAEMTSRQTGALAVSHGLGWGVDAAGAGYGHGGALSTDMWIDPAHGLAMIYLVHHAGYANDDGGAILPAFRAAALEAFGQA